MKLKVYTTTNCPNCRVVKSYLLAMGVDFEEVLLKDPEMIEELVAKTGCRKVPVVENGKGFVVGFKPEEIKALVS